MTRSLLKLLLAVSFTAALAAAGSARAEPTQRSVDHVCATVDCLPQRRDPDLRDVLAVIPGYNGLNQPPAEFYNRGAIAEGLLDRDFESIGAAARAAE